LDFVLNLVWIWFGFCFKFGLDFGLDFVLNLVWIWFGFWFKFGLDFGLNLFPKGLFFQKVCFL
jgi:hypothetical protein